MKTSTPAFLLPMALAVIFSLSDLSLSIASSSESSFLRGNNIQSDDIEANHRNAIHPNKAKTRGRLLQMITTPPPAVPPGQWVNLGPPMEGDNIFDGFGSSLVTSKDGSLIAVGAPLNDENGSESGHVKFFRYFEGNSMWIPVGENIVGDFKGDRSGFAMDMSGDGDVVVIGSFRNSRYNHLGGQVRIFRNINGEWVQEGDLYGTVDDGFFGYTVAISRDGKKIIAGAPKIGDGLVRVFEYREVSSDGNPKWDQIGGDIKAPGASFGSENFGHSVGMNEDGNIIAVGAIYFDNGDIYNPPGLVRVYKYSADGQFVQQGQNLVGDNGYDSFGWSIALSGDGKKVIVGSPKSISGSAFIYRFNEENKWDQAGGVITGEAPYGDEAGSSVAISDDGDIVVVGSNRNRDAGDDAGHVRVFRFIEEQWVQQGQTLISRAPGAKFGESVAISPDGKRVIVGAPQTADGIGGYVQVYSFQDATSSPTSTPTTAHTHTPTATPTTTPTHIPTTTPTSTPTVAPTPEPSTSTPTNAPTPYTSSPPTTGDVTSYAFCSDSPLMFMVQGIPRCCKWVARNPTERCDEMWGKGAGLDISIKTHCPETCGSCSEVGCSDTVGMFTVDDHDNIECCWLDSLSISHKQDLCFEDRIYSTCPETCDFCAD